MPGGVVGLTWGLTSLLLLGSSALTPWPCALAGPAACPLYDLLVPEGSSKHVEINITEKSRVLCKMQTASSKCEELMALYSTETLHYYNSTFKGRISLSDHLRITVMNASKWMADEYRVVTDLHERCMARINLTVPDPVSSLPPIWESPTAGAGPADSAGEGNSRGMPSNDSPEQEPRGHYGLWASLAFSTFLIFAVFCVCCKREERPQSHHRCEEEGISNPGDSPTCQLARLAASCGQKQHSL